MDKDEMVIRPYTDEDYETICEWFKGHKIPPPLKDFLPATGYIAEGLACGFLIQTDASMGILDFFVSNHLSDKNLKNEAIDRIMKLLMHYAKNIGLLGVKGDTQNLAMAQRCIKHEFLSLGKFSSFIKEI